MEDLEKKNKRGKLTIVCGGMGGGKTTLALTKANDAEHIDGLSVLVVQPEDSYRDHIETASTATARSRMSYPRELIPSNEPLLSVYLAQRKNADIVFYLDSHMFEPHSLIGAIVANLNKGIDVFVDSLTYDFGGEVFPVIRELSPHANKIERKYRRCNCQPKGDEPQGKYNQLVVRTPFSKKEDLLRLLAENDPEGKNIKLRVLVEYGIEDPLTHFIIPAYFGPTNICGDIDGRLGEKEGISFDLEYLSRCDICFVRPKKLSYPP